MSPPSKLCRIVRRRPVQTSHNRNVERCNRCRTAPYLCRACGTPCCGHRCSEIDPQTASCLCGKCSLQGRRRKV